MIENPDELQLTKEGRVYCRSGKLAVLSPCIAHGLGRNLFSRFDGTDLIPDPNKRRILTAERKYYKLLLADTKRAIELAEAGKKIPDIPDELLNLEARVKLLRAKVDDKVREKQKQGFFSPPRMVEGKAGVYLRMEGGNTTYAITRDGQQGFNLHNDAPVEKKGTIGMVMAYSSQVMIADAEKVRIMKKYAKDAAVFDAEEGIFVCYYTKDRNRVKVVYVGKDDSFFTEAQKGSARKQQQA